MSISDQPTYNQQMIAYYYGAKYGHDWEAVRQSYLRSQANVKPSLRRAMLMLQDAFRGRRVLELAAGGGQWSREIAQTAKTVLATDTSERVLEVGRSLTEEINITYRRCDAFDVSEIDGSFSGAFHFNFINHLCYTQWAGLVEHLHTKLEAGAVVVMGG